MKFVVLWLALLFTTVLCVFIASVETSIPRFSLEALFITAIIAFALRPFTPKY